MAKQKQKTIIDYLEAKMSGIEKARKVCGKVWGKIILQIAKYPLYSAIGVVGLILLLFYL
ncbi:MAG: hypothetical protein CML86_07390 [Rhodobiaceae bacterium]|jgi:hypothetical protein|nr:hypothetical protein [Rhodobiaceae bacterium]|tara:strand:- start:987 stop:1166 length:180 start_codon:yes stop_codon:yes gene_type:complete